jgi:hypothetical protein
MLDSSLWVDRLAREIFITALLMAEPIELREPMVVLSSAGVPAIHFKEVPPGWYGFVPAAGPGIIRRAGIEDKSAKIALDRLGEPDYQSRNPDWSGRRMVRVAGGFIILNFDKYRTKDHTAAERARRYRERQASRVTSVASRKRTRNVTQAEAEAEAEKKEEGANGSRPASVSDWLKELQSQECYKSIDIKIEYGKMCTWCQVHGKQPTQRRFVNWINRAERPINAASTFDAKPKLPAPTGEAYKPIPPPRDISDAEFQTAAEIAKREVEKLRQQLRP